MTAFPENRGLGIGLLGIKRKIFVSYHHRRDQYYYDCFSQVFHDSYDIIFDNSLERKVDSDNSEYVMRQIRENYISGSSCTIVLVGAETWGRKFVDWEIFATLTKQHGLIGMQLPTISVVGNTIRLPDRLFDNIKSNYALWKRWDDLIANPGMLPLWIEESNRKSKQAIKNERERRVRNAFA